MPQTKKVKKLRIEKMASCLRRTSATAPVSRKASIDSKTFASDLFVSDMSGKFAKLIETINQIDALDMKNDGHMYKHFIFTDIREGSYGGKALAGFLIAAGFDFRQGVVKKLVKRRGEMVETKTGATALIEKEPVEGGCNGFAILQSVPLFKNPTSVSEKKRILQVFNSRPDNVHGEKLRIMVLDSKYKEGIDLFDVRYVHLLEPAIATSDLKQAVGRATRFCGQKGLQFVPNKGWTLDVFVYRTELPGRNPFTEVEGQKIDAHSLMLEKSGLDLALLNLTQDLTVLAIRTSVDYDLNYRINNFQVEAEQIDVVEAVVEVIPTQSGGAVAVHDVADITPALMMKCFKRKSELFPYTRRQIFETARYLGLPLKKTSKRAQGCELIRENPELLKALLNPRPSMRAPKQRDVPVLPSLKMPLAPPPSLASAPKSTGIRGSDLQRLFQTPEPSVRGSDLQRLFQTPEPSVRGSDLQRLFQTPTPQQLFPEPSELSSGKGSALRRLFKTPKRLEAELDRVARLPFNQFQKRITELYAKFAWESPIVKSGCEDTAVVKAGRPVTFSKTQDFVRHYLTPASPFKGLLAWHSVGTGKTCMAVAAATSSFEAEGYNILWVTRNALMADVYKNIFGSVCSAPLIKEIEDNGLVIPADKSKAKRLLSRSWFAPITYRMLQNALKKENALGRSLYAANPEDPLKNTFLIIDEIHKLQDGDLSAGEAADFNFIREQIWKSYDMSGEDSVRPLLMTATPITDTPKELFEILNILIPRTDSRLMDFSTFREKFADEDGHINEEGQNYFQNKAKGLISYLNREYDPTTFAQPHFHQIPVPVGETAVPDMDELIKFCTAELTLKEEEAMDCGALAAERDAELAMIKEMPKKESRGLGAATRQKYKEMISDCKKQTRRVKQGNKKAMKELLKTASACYRRTKKAYTARRRMSQMFQLEKCFGKAPPAGFIPQKIFKEEVVERFLYPEPEAMSAKAVINDE